MDFDYCYGDVSNDNDSEDDSDGDEDDDDGRECDDYPCRPRPSCLWMVTHLMVVNIIKLSST